MTESDDARELEALVARAQEGDPDAVAALRKRMDERPSFWQATGDLAHQCELSWLQAAAGSDEVAKEAIARKAKALRREVAGPAPAPLEKLLTDRICLCWLALHYFETVYAQNVGRLSLDIGTYQQERIDRAHRRYLSSIRALAQLRRVSLTAVRVLDPAGRQLEAAQVAVDGR